MLHQAPILRAGFGEVKSYQYAQNSLTCSPYRWRIDHGSFWGVPSLPGYGAHLLRRMPLTDLTLFDKTKTDREKQFAARYPKTPYDSNAHSLGLEPLGCATHRLLLREGRIPPQGDFLVVARTPPVTADGLYADVIPTAAQRILLLFCEDKIMHVWRGSGFRNDEDHHEWQMTWDNEAEEQFAVPFREPFMTYLLGQEYWFVTETGKLYRSGSPQKRKVEVDWDEEASPIRVLITNADRDDTFAFTEPEPGRKGRAVFFRVGGTPDPKPYQRREKGDFKGPKPLATVLSFTEVLLEHKALKLPLPQPRKSN